MENWEYENIIGSGATSYVFSGYFNGKPVAIKWMTKKDAQKEMKNIRLIRQGNDYTLPLSYRNIPIIVSENNLLLPYSHICGRWFLEDIVGEGQFPPIKTLGGPGLVKDRRYAKYKLKGTGKDLLSCLMVFPLVKGDLRGVDLRKHKVEEVIRDIKQALNILHARDPPIYHADLALRNIFYYFDEDGNVHYLLGDFGKIKLQDYDIQEELKKIISKF